MLIVVLMVMQNIVFFGDSHTARSGFNLKYRPEYKTHMCAESGNGPDRIIENIYEFIKKDMKEIKFKNEETLFVIEYSYLSRLYLPRKKSDDSTFSGQFHSLIYDGDMFLGYEITPHSLNVLYNFFLLNFYDEEIYFNRFKMNVTLVNAFLEKSGIKFINYLWDTSAISETNGLGKRNIHLKELEELNFIEFEPNQFLFGKIAERDRLRIYDETGVPDYHLSENGYEVLKKHLDKKIEKFLD